MFKALATGALLVIMAADMLMVPVQGQEDGWKTTVLVQNDLGDGIYLYLHCRSKDDDLGLHILANGQYQAWSFMDNIRGTTLFWCTMKWNNMGQSFEIYSAKQDDPQCKSKCWRSIRQDGAYFYFEFKDYWYKRYAW